METDCYRLLGIVADADNRTIRKAWRNKTKEVHPDVNDSPDAAKQFRELTQAMELLLDPAKRLRHDRHFGYYEKPKNQDANTKQQFSDYQQQKAGRMVSEWSKDYSTAMQMREEQRQRVIRRHRRNIFIVLAALLALVLSLAGWLIFRK